MTQAIQFKNSISDRIGAIFRRINSYATSANYPLLAPFATSLWAVLLVWCLVNFILYRIITHFLENIEMNSGDEKIISGNSSFLSVFGVICLQGQEKIVH